MGFLFNRDAVFYDLFDQLAEKAVVSTSLLRSLATGFPATVNEIDRIHAVEAEADVLNHRVLDRLNHSFMPPIDSVDVHALAGELDDIVDTVDSIAKRFSIYHVDAVEPIFVRQTEVLASGVAKVNEAVHQLRQSRRFSDLATVLAEIHTLESVGDDNHHAALLDLFAGKATPLHVIKWKELHTLIEQAIDQCERGQHARTHHAQERLRTSGSATNLKE
jgi:uncharacterized protein Yka (UPF0111/DUF47 family)